MTLGENLRRLRKEKGLSQEKTARALFVSRQSVSKWENDRAEPGVENLKILSQLYDRTIGELVDGTQEGDGTAARREERFQARDLFQLAAAVRFLTVWYGIFFIDEGLLLYGWDLPLLFAGIRFQNQVLWGTVLALEGASLFVYLIAAAKAFWFWYNYEVWLPFQFLLVTVGTALTLAMLLQKKTRTYFCRASELER